MKLQRTFSDLLSLLGRMPAWVLILPACGGEAAITDDPSEAQDEAEVGQIAQYLQCDGGVDRVSVTSITPAPNGAIGRISSPSGTCTATVISPTQILTAQHCLGNVAPSSVTFSPQFGIATSGVAPFNPAPQGVRIVQGREQGAGFSPADWAIVTLNTNLTTLMGSSYQEMGVQIPAAAPFSITQYGYHQDGFFNRPARQSCSVVTNQGGTLFSNCDIDGGGSGGPLWITSGGLPKIMGVQSAHPSSASCTGTSGPSSVNAEQFIWAPRNAGGAAVAYTGDGRMVVYASDKDRAHVGYRHTEPAAPNSQFTWWMQQALSSPTAGTNGRMAAVNLADNRQELWFVDSSGGLQTKWQTVVDGGWSAWTAQSTVVPVKDVAVSGGFGVTTHLFVLGTDNIVRVAWKTGDSNSAWSAWNAIGGPAVTNAKALTAVHFAGVHQMFVTGSNGMFTSWGASAPFGSQIGFGDPLGTGLLGTAAALKTDGAVVLYATTSNGLFSRTRATSGSWSNWIQMVTATPFNSGGLTTLATGRHTDGRVRLLATGTNGELYSVETTPFIGTSWINFYDRR